jgi:sugar phosphate isomerase/epimerase
MDLLLREAEKRGFTLCHENEKGIYGCSAAREKKLLDHFGGRLRAVLDNGNFHFCGFTAEGAYTLLKDYIEYLHIKDCGNDGIIVPPGHGDAFIKETLREVNADRKGTVVLTMEPHLVHFTGLSTLSKIDDIKHKYSFDSPYEAFAYATENVKRIIAEL